MYELATFWFFVALTLIVIGVDIYQHLRRGHQ